MEISGKNIIGCSLSGNGQNTYSAYNPLTGVRIAPDFFDASVEEVNLALELAELAFIKYRDKPFKQVALFLCILIQKNMRFLY